MDEFRFVDVGSAGCIRSRSIEVTLGTGRIIWRNDKYFVVE